MVESASSDDFRCKKDAGTFQPNSRYDTNLKSGLKTLVDETTKEKLKAEKGFSVVMTEDDKEEGIIAIAQCAAYLNPKDCTSCVNKTIPLLQQKCTNQKKAVAWAGTCLVTYGPYTFQNYDPWFIGHEIGDGKVKDVKGLEKALSELFLNVTDEAFEGDLVPILYAFGTQLYGSPSQHLYMIVQCSLDVAASYQCDECLNLLYKEIKPCCSGASALAMYTSNCYLRYAHHDFRTK